MKNSDDYFDGLAKQYGKHNPIETALKLKVLYPSPKKEEPKKEPSSIKEEKEKS